MSETKYECLQLLGPRPGVLEIRMNRPERHNAFNATLIEELHRAFRSADEDAACRVVLLTGAGRSFSAGADIDWMREQGTLSEEENRASAREMAAMFESIRGCRRPVIAKIQGAALGGGTGLCAAVDIALAGERAKFGFTEVRLGILPAVISPYALEKLGPGAARALFLLGSRIDAKEAERLGLVHRACPDDALDQEVESTLDEILRGAPGALEAAKRLVLTLSPVRSADWIEHCAGEIARLRGLPEAQEGLSAFLEKRSPSWIS